MDFSSTEDVGTVYLFGFIPVIRGLYSRNRIDKNTWVDRIHPCIRWATCIRWYATSTDSDHYRDPTGRLQLKSTHVVHHF